MRLKDLILAPVFLLASLTTAGAQTPAKEKENAQEQKTAPAPDIQAYTDTMRALGFEIDRVVKMDSSERNDNYRIYSVKIDSAGNRSVAVRDRLKGPKGSPLSANNLQDRYFCITPVTSEYKVIATALYLNYIDGSFIGWKNYQASSPWREEDIHMSSAAVAKDLETIAKNPDKFADNIGRHKEKPAAVKKKPAVPPKKTPHQ